MSQLTLTPEETVLVLNSVRTRHAQTLSAYGVEDADLVALLAKIESQLTSVVESAPEATPVAEPEVVAEAPQEVAEEPAAE
jgi:hypothetical protein